MSYSRYVYTLFGLIFAGVLFSGYLSGVKFFTKTCAFGEGCPLFLGYPACYFGFGLFLSLFIAFLFGLFQKISYKISTKSISIISVLGAVFAGQYVIGESILVFQNGFVATIIGLPTCAYGFVFFILILITSISFSSKLSSSTQ